MAIDEKRQQMIADWTEIAKAMFPYTRREPIKRNMPFIMDAINGVWGGDWDIPISFILVCLATIRAETEGFEPIPEQESKYNTARGGPAFGLYEGKRTLGNTKPGDGARFKGRGFVQLTGRANYEKYSTPGTTDLVDNPELALEPRRAAQLLARFVKDKWTRIRDALLKGDCAKARAAVNGGKHGLEKFVDAYRRGEAYLRQL